MRKIITIMIILTLLFTTPAYAAVSMDDVKDTINGAKETIEEAKETITSVAAAVADAFADIKNSDWFAEAVQSMSKIGIIKGYPDGTFKPQKAVTYGEFIKLMVVATTGEDIGNSQTGHWAESYYNKAIELGLFTEADITKANLSQGMPRQAMALLISNNFKNIKVDNYDLIQDSIKDLHESQYYQHEIIKAYGLGILTGYPDNTYKPDGTLTRAESTTVINRILNEDQRVKPTFTNTGKDAYWKNDPDYNEIADWYNEMGKKNNYLHSQYSIEEGKIHFKDECYPEWVIDDTNYLNIHRDIYIVLKEYYYFAKETDRGVHIIGTQGTGSVDGQGTIVIQMLDSYIATQPLYSFDFSAEPLILDKEGYVPAYICFNPNKYSGNKDREKLGSDYIIEHDRVGEQRHVDTNKKIFQLLYGKETGTKIWDYTFEKFKGEFDKENKAKIDLPDERTNIDDINVYYWEIYGDTQYNLDQPK